MKRFSKKFITFKDEVIFEMTDSSHEVELNENQMPLTSNELAILRICNGDLKHAKNIIRDIEERIHQHFSKMGE